MQGPLVPCCPRRLAFNPFTQCTHPAINPTSHFTTSPPATTAIPHSPLALATPTLPTYMFYLPPGCKPCDRPSAMSMQKSICANCLGCQAHFLLFPTLSLPKGFLPVSPIGCCPSCKHVENSICQEFKMSVFQELQNPCNRSKSPESTT